MLSSTSKSCKVMETDSTMRQLTQCGMEAHGQNSASLAEAGLLVQCLRCAAWSCAGQAQSRAAAAAAGGAVDGADGLAPRG